MGNQNQIKAFCTQEKMNTNENKSFDSNDFQKNQQPKKTSCCGTKTEANAQKKMVTAQCQCDPCTCCQCEDCSCDPCTCCACGAEGKKGGDCGCGSKTIQEKKGGCCGTKSKTEEKKGGCCGDKNTTQPKQKLVTSNCTCCSCDPCTCDPCQCCNCCQCDDCKCDPCTCCSCSAKNKKGGDCGCGSKKTEGKKMITKDCSCCSCDPCNCDPCECCNCCQCEDCTCDPCTCCSCSSTNKKSGDCGCGSKKTEAKKMITKDCSCCSCDPCNCDPCKCCNCCQCENCTCDPCTCCSCSSTNKKSGDCGCGSKKTEEKKGGCCGTKKDSKPKMMKTSACQCDPCTCCQCEDCTCDPCTCCNCESKVNTTKAKKGGCCGDKPAKKMVTPQCKCCSCDPCTCDPCQCCSCDPCNCQTKSQSKKVEKKSVTVDEDTHVTIQKGDLIVEIKTTKVDAQKKGGCKCGSK